MGSPIKSVTIILLLIAGIATGWFGHAFMQAEPEPHAMNVINQSVTPAFEQKPVVVAEQKKPATMVMLPMSKPDPLQAFQKLLAQGDFASALAAWPRQSAYKARTSVFKLAHRLSQKNEAAIAAGLLAEYRNHFPDDVEAGLLQANLLQQMGQFDEQAYLLIDLLKQTADVNDVARINSLLHSAVQSHKDYLMQREDYVELLSFYRRLSNLDGANQEYQLMQARALIEMGQLQQASTILQPLVYDAEAGGRAKSLLKQIDKVTGADYEVSIALQRSGDHFLVPLSVNGRAPVLLLLDTGASITLLQRELAGSTVGKLTNISMQTANGRMEVPLLKSNRVTLGSYQMKDIDIALINKPVGPSAKGLLGMNVLKRFDFFIDQKTATLKLSRRIAEH